MLSVCLSGGYNGCLAKWQCFNKWQGWLLVADRLEFANIYLAIHWCTLMMVVARWSWQCYANGNISRWWPPTLPQICQYFSV